VLGRLVVSTDAERLAVGALRFAAQSGGPMAETLDRAASTLRDLEQITNERSVQSSSARLSALVMSALPVVFGTWSISSDDRVRGFALGTPMGVACLAAGAGLTGLGWWWMKVIIRGVS
jgi:tight adherence protein B